MGIADVVVRLFLPSKTLLNFTEPIAFGQDGDIFRCPSAVLFHHLEYIDTHRHWDDVGSYCSSGRMVHSDCLGIGRY